MLKRCAIPAIVLMTARMFLLNAQAQTVPASKPGAPAPRHDISGIWDPGNAGIQGRGARSMPADGKPEHELPYTPLGLEMFKRNRPANGPTEVAAAEVNDPGDICDPQGFPR